MKIAYIDSCVLIGAFRGLGDAGRKALEVLDEQDLEFASSEFVRLEVMAKPVHFGREIEAEFYRTFFSGVKHWAQIDRDLVQEAYRHASSDGLSALDALHVAAAMASKADEFVTSEKPEKAIYRARALRVRSIRK